MKKIIALVLALAMGFLVGLIIAVVLSAVTAGENRKDHKDAGEDEKKRVMVPHGSRWHWKATTVEEIIRDCVDSLFKSAQRDCEYQDSEEYFAEMCSNNGWTFEEDGSRRDAA